MGNQVAQRSRKPPYRKDIGVRISYPPPTQRSQLWIATLPTNLYKLTLLLTSTW